MIIKKYGLCFLIFVSFFTSKIFLSSADDAVPAVVLNKEIQPQPDQTLADPPEKKIPAVVNLNQLCAETYRQKATCPKDFCKLFCLEGESGKACTLDCEPRPCVEISVENCPTDTCQVLEGCGDNVKRCYPKMIQEPPDCGGLSYSGKLNCCKGFVKRCGVEYFDGSCDMTADYSLEGVPQCLPCGNGICNQFENRCNCPEDCGKK